MEVLASLSGAEMLPGLLVTCALGALIVLLMRREGRPLGPRLTVPIFGDTLAMTFGDPVRFLFRRYKEYGSVFRVHLMGRSLYVVTDMEALRGPYQRDEEGTPEVPFPTFKQLMGDYNVLGTKHVHVPWRKAMLASLGPQGMQALFPRVADVMRGYLREWEAEGKVHVFRTARRLGLDLSVDVIMGVELSDRVDRGWFKDKADTWLQGLFGLPVRVPGGVLSRALAAKEALLRVLMREVEQVHERTKRKWIECGGDLLAVSGQLAAESPSGITSPLDIERLGFLGLNRMELRDSAMSALHGVMAAADTTRFALFNTWALLAMSPRVQDKLYEEQKQVVSEHGPEVTFKAVASMPYMEATIKECMRLLAATSGGPRRLTADLHVKDVVIPAGSFVWLYSHLMHCLDPVLWDGDTSADLPPHMDWRGNLDAAFRPERWLSEDTKPKHFFTFGLGNHLCAGQNLVYMELKLVLSMVLRKYRLVLETPDMLARSRLFPFTQPVKGTDTMRLVPREEPLPCVV